MGNEGQAGMSCNFAVHEGVGVDATALAAQPSSAPLPLPCESSRSLPPLHITGSYAPRITDET